jgi:hypothetical protein
MKQYNDKLKLFEYTSLQDKATSGSIVMQRQKRPEKNRTRTIDH